MLKIGSLQLKSNLLLSPLAGISDLAFRELNRMFGCELAFTEMLNCRSLSHKSRRTKEMLASNKDDKPLGVQLLGSEPKYLLKALEVVRGYDFDILDFNAACPARKVVRRGEGAALLKEPKKLFNLLVLLVKHSSFPVTVKIRTGWDEDCVNAQEVARYCADAGVQAICIHGRTMKQGYSGKIDYAVIRGVKKVVSIPVIASGDLLSAELAKKMLDETGVDGLAIARGALGNPWIFREIEEYLKQKKLISKPSVAEITDTMLLHLRACGTLYGERIGAVKFRKFFSWYTKGFRVIRPLREKSSRAKTIKEVQEIILKARASNTRKANTREPFCEHRIEV